MWNYWITVAMVYQEDLEDIKGVRRRRRRRRRRDNIIAKRNKDKRTDNDLQHY